MRKYLPKAKKNVEIKPRTCSRCNEMNAPDSRHCRRCGGIVDLQFAMELEIKQQQEEDMRKVSDHLMNMLLKDPEVQQLLMQKMSVMQST